MRNKKNRCFLHLLSAVSLFCSCGCSYQKVELQKDSVLRRDIHIYSEAEEVKEAILSRLPLGSSKFEMKKFLAANFLSPVTADFWFSDDEQYSKYLDNKKICYRILKTGKWPASGSWTNVVFIFEA